MTACFLIGGGWSSAAAPHVYGPFLDAAGGGRAPANRHDAGNADGAAPPRGGTAPS